MSDTGSPWIVEVQEKDFDREVIEKSKEKPVVVDFWAAWCGPCRMLAPLLEKAVNERNGEVILAKVNTDENPGIASQYYIQALPTVMAFRDGQIVFQMPGLLPEAQIRQLLDDLAPSEADKLAKQAAALESSDPVQAESLYRRALELDDRLDEVQVALARVLVEQNKNEAEARSLLENAAVSGPLEEEVERLTGILAVHDLAREYGDADAAQRKLDADPDNARLQYELGCILASKGEYQKALDLLLSAAERDHKLATGKVREAMVNVFHMIGNQSEMANDYRQRLAGLLY